jgi:hypothetical protein
LRDKVKVLYIAGQGRSGSTILGNTLGQVQGFMHVGELLEVWGILMSGRVPCGCGVPVVDCKMWEDVVKEAYGGRDESLIAQMLEFRNLEVRSRAFPRAMTSKSVRTLQQRLAKPLAELDRLYRAVQKTFNCEVIVDSSKHPMYAYLLQLTDGIDPHVLHLTRDARACVYSFLRKRVENGYLFWTRDLSPLRASMMWNYKNGVVEILSKRFHHLPLHMRYEDFISDPRGSLQQILSFMNEPCSSFPFQEEHSLNLEAQHTVSGNPSRFLTGKVELRENCAWKNEMKWYDRLVVSATTWPLLLKYGYRGDNVVARNLSADTAGHVDTRTLRG